MENGGSGMGMLGSCPLHGLAPVASTATPPRGLTASATLGDHLNSPCGDCHGATACTGLTRRGDRCTHGGQCCG
jgi:hypothetical protein